MGLDITTLAIAKKYVDDTVEGKGIQKGQDGYTPKKGVDYWTENDKAEIKSYVDQAVNNITKPSLNLGIEYDANELWLGKNVFTRLIAFSSVTKDQILSLEDVDWAQGISIIRISGTMVRIQSGTAAIVGPLPIGSTYVEANNLNKTITVYDKNEIQSKRVYVQIWYIKEAIKP